LPCDVVGDYDDIIALAATVCSAEADKAQDIVSLSRKCQEPEAKIGPDQI